MAKFPISCRPASYGKHSMYAYEHLPEIGVKYVEINAPTKQKEADITLEMLEDMELKALSVCFPIDINDKKIVKKFENSMPFIKQLNPMYIFSSVKVKKEKKRAEGYPILQEMGDIAKANDIFISVETHPFYNTNGDRGKETMEAVNHPNVKINFDTANIYFYNKGVDGKEELSKVKPWLGSIHIKDCMKNYKAWEFPTIGEGKVDYPGILNMVDDLDQTIPFTLEIEGVKGEKLNLEETKERVKKSVEYLRSLSDHVE